MLVDGAIDTERDALEPPETGEDSEDTDAEDDALRADGEPAGGKDEVINKVSEHENGEVQRRKVVVDVSNSAHDHEGDWEGRN